MDLLESYDKNKKKHLLKEVSATGAVSGYDKIIDKTEENEKFINDTNDWKSIYDSKKY